MLSDEKILITGPAGQIAFPLAEALARDNEVWGVARFGNPATRDEVEAAGITTRTADLGGGDFGDLPTDFTYVLHLAALMANDRDYDEAIRVNAEGTALLLEHCRAAKAVLVMSTQSTYQPHEDPAHVFLETDPLGDAHSLHSPPYSISKIAEEAVARSYARTLNLPIVIARMNSSYSARGGLPTQHMAAVVAGNAVTTRWDPCYYSPIHQDDINDRELRRRRAGVGAAVGRVLRRARRGRAHAARATDRGHVARVHREQREAARDHRPLQGVVEGRLPARLRGALRVTSP
jgi:nucleoside-diphosphate-sugar epimerase